MHVHFFSTSLALTVLVCGDCTVLVFDLVQQYMEVASYMHQYSLC